MQRHTCIREGRLAVAEQRLAAAREGRHGMQVLTIDQMAARLAGGFVGPLTAEALNQAVQKSLPEASLGELEPIKSLPGTAAAVCETLRRMWLARFDLADAASRHGRLAAMAELERLTLSRLPSTMLEPRRMAEAAMAGLAHAKALLGVVEIEGVVYVPPCWRPLLIALAETVPVTWVAGPTPVPDWVTASSMTVTTSPPASPAVCAVSAASAHHEALEAMRWARGLISSGAAKPSEIAIAAASTDAHDAALLAMREEGGLHVHFVHGVRVVGSPEGQAAAALADILVNGLTQDRLRRVPTLTDAAGPIRRLPDGWRQVLPRDAPLSTPAAWARLLGSIRAEDWPDGIDHADELREVVDVLLEGTARTAEAGPMLLSGPALAIWRKALSLSTPAAIATTIDGLRRDDVSDGSSHVVWAPASSIASAPRRFVRLLGLTSSGWPRRAQEDRIVSDHIVPGLELDPFPCAVADREHFHVIMRTTAEQIVLSRARRDAAGRPQGSSPLMKGQPRETHLRRNRRPDHAMSEADRLTARLEDFRGDPRAASARACWSDWRRETVTAHDGLARAAHPLLADALDRTQSASSLSRLLRDPVGYVWRYALGVRKTERVEEPLLLDARRTGNLLHEILDLSVRVLGGEALGGASDEQLSLAVDAATGMTAEQWNAREVVPPGAIWRRTLADARQNALRALRNFREPLDGQATFTEVPFGGQPAKHGAVLPWDPDRAVEIGTCGFRISGFIDRLDVSGDGRVARVVDYKSGKLPKADFVLRGGLELQRCLYAFAVRELLGDDVRIDAALYFPRDDETRRLVDPVGALGALDVHLDRARESLLAGLALPGPDSGADRDDFAFALPANAANTYRQRKSEPVLRLLGDAAAIWETN